ARDQLAGNAEVASVENNYAIDRPPGASQVQGPGLPPPPRLELNPPPDNGRVIVGLVDTGVQPLGNDLDKFLLKGIFVAGDPQFDPASPSHGTSMAETLLRSLQAATGGKTAVQILPVDVYGPNATTSTFDVAQGIQQAVNGGANIINLSLGSEADSPFLRDLIQQANDKKILVIAAAGNQPVTTPFYPAAYPGVNAVTAIDQGQLAAYASRGSFVTLGAPGTSIVYLNGQAYAVTGTSASAAFTSGVAAGYMDRTGTGTAQAQTYLNRNFGVSITPAPGK
ncbi:MAG TPA: S8 family serine peptidase, partial [Bacillota bacterium]|nr:S8 family serine peptidase [Bacillota bacterium]